MSTHTTLPTKGFGMANKITAISADAASDDMIIDFQVDYELAAIVQVQDSLGAIRALTDLAVTYPANGQVRVANNALIEAMVLANDLKAELNAHFIDATSHVTAIDEVNTVVSPDATTFATLLTLGDELLDAYDVHDDDAELGSSWLYHEAQESGDHSPTDVTALTTIAECTTQLNDLRTKYNAHDADTDAHNGAASANQLSAAAIGSSFAFTAGDVVTVIAEIDSDAN